jgi:C4-dicarboxylate-specific signal transduction histidine kinase
LVAEQKHLLIVDDEAVVLGLLRSVMEGEPYRLSTASSCSEAAAILKNDPVALLLTDKNLPDGNGLELVRLCKEQNPMSEAIILTGYGSLETAIEAIELDVFDYLQKPLRNIFDIRLKIRHASQKQDVVLENQRLLAELQEKNQALEAALEETRSLQDELIQSEKLAGIGTLAAGIAHEISSPLFGVMGMAEAIIDEQDMALSQGYARDIVEYCRQIRDIVLELSSYSRSSTNEYLTTVDLSRVVQDAVKLVERSSYTGPVRYELEIEPGLFLHARTNEIQQVFVNLIKNAAEAVGERYGEAGGGVVQVRAGKQETATGSMVWIRVSDNGPGIPESKQRMIFDPFYTTKPPGKGTGLGLNIVYRIVTRYRGAIVVQSQLDAGTSFELKFPIEK